MGSNSFRLVVYELRAGSCGGASSTRSARRSGQRRHGRRAGAQARAASSARLTPHPCSRASAAARASTAWRRWPRARSATPPTGEELLAGDRAPTGLDPRVISGEEEARYGYLAIANSTTVEDGFGLDVGGGSIQTMRIEAPPARGGVAAAGQRARQRGVPARGEGARQGDEGAAAGRGEELGRARLVERRQAGSSGSGRDDPEPGGGGDEAHGAARPGRSGLRPHARRPRGADRAAGREPASKRGGVAESSQTAAT